MAIRIEFSRQMVKELQTRLQQAYEKDDVRLVRRISVLLDYVVHKMSVAVLSERWGISPACIYNWLNAFLICRMESLVYRHGGGRKAKLTPTQRKRLAELIDAGPKAAGFETACWSSVLIRILIEREFGVLYNRFYVCDLLHNLGFSFQKARFVSDHLDEARRQAWINEKWPKILKQAKLRRAMILFGDEASFPQWGSLSYTWARRGQQPLVKTTGKRKAYKVFGFIELFSGRLFYRGVDGKFNADSYQTALQEVMSQTKQHLFLIQDGAKYHTSKAMQKFFKKHCNWLTVCQLPSYSPDYNPIEYLWRKTKKRATHNQYHERFEHLTVSVEEALAHFASHSQEVLGLFGLYCDEVGLERKLAA